MTPPSAFCFLPSAFCLLPSAFCLLPWYKEPAALELVRLTFPRRVYTQSHIDYLAEALEYVAARRAQIRGLRIVYQAPTLRHFTARFEGV